eukprot:s1421_g15.t1
MLAVMIVILVTGCQTCQDEALLTLPTLRNTSGLAAMAKALAKAKPHELTLAQCSKPKNEEGVFKRPEGQGELQVDTGVGLLGDHSPRQWAGLKTPRNFSSNGGMAMNGQAMNGPNGLGTRTESREKRNEKYADGEKIEKSLMLMVCFTNGICIQDFPPLDPPETHPVLPPIQPFLP